MAKDYLGELASYEDPEVFKTKDRVIQFPFVAPVFEEKSEEEQARLAAKRKEQGRRLQEQAAKARLEKVGEASNCFEGLSYDFRRWLFLQTPKPPERPSIV